MNINPRCDLLIGNRPENDSDAQYYECEDCHRYEICKKHGCVEVCYFEEIKEAKPSILEPSYDLLEQEGYFEMNIGEQVKKLRELADCYYGEIRHHVSTIMKAADTIEALSAKLAAANMENVGGWIACEDRLPEEEKYYLVTIINWEKKPAIEYCLFQNEKWYIVADGSTEENTTWKEEINSVIAWQPLPEPYRP